MNINFTNKMTVNLINHYLLSYKLATISQSLHNLGSI